VTGQTRTISALRQDKIVHINTESCKLRVPGSSGDAPERLGFPESTILWVGKVSIGISLILWARATPAAFQVYIIDFSPVE
jgi:hypothetical protein